MDLTLPGGAMFATKKPFVTGNDIFQKKSSLELLQEMLAPKVAPIDPALIQLVQGQMAQAQAAGPTETASQLLAAPRPKPDLLSEEPQVAQPVSQGNFWGDALANYGKSWSTPGFASQWPFPRGEQNSPALNLGAGFMNNLLGTPQNIWNAGAALTGKGTTQAVQEGAQSLADWFTKPEGQINAEQNPPQAEGGIFSPGIPDFVAKVNQAESSGNPTARNPKSSAYGAGQFLKSTWLEFMREVHPEVLKGLGEKGALELRAKPEYSDEAVAWYAGKGVDALDDINAPATDTNLYLHHFLGSGGVKSLLRADPNAKASKVLSEAQVKANPTVLGGNKTVQDVIDWAAAHVGEGAGLRPTPRPAQEIPDFTLANNWYDQAAPQGVDPQTLKNAQFQLMLEGIGAGLGSVNAGREGGGALFGALASGASSGVSAGQKLAMDFENQLKADKASYAKGRGDLATQQEAAQSAVRDANAQTSWLDEQDARNYDNAQIALQRSKNAPKILESSAQGIWVQKPDQSVEFISNKTPWDQMEQMGKALGADSAQVRGMKYGQLAQTGNLLAMEMEIIKDVLGDGLGASVFGDGYSEAMAEAEKLLPGGLAATPDKALPELNKIMSGLLLGASQQAGNYDWVQQAAALGHPGAMMLVQGGSMK